MCQTVRLFGVLGALLLATWAAHADDATTAAPDPEPQTAEEAKPKSEKKPPPISKTPILEEVVVVTGSRTEQPLHEVPCAMTVIDSEALMSMPADDVGDYLRNVPGLNVSQISTRDIQVGGRSASSTLETHQLVLVDNRSIYVDFFGFVMWDALPLDPSEIKQIEVVRGPGSAVWGANAMNGVINILTKSPKEMVGTSLTVGAGDRGTLIGNITYADTIGKLGIKATTSYYQQHPYARPTGFVPDTAGPIFPEGTPYPPFENQGTTQPKVSLRVDYDLDEETRWSIASGYAGTEGIIHSGVGPFDVQSGTFMGYGQYTWAHRALQANFFYNRLRGDALNLITQGTDGQPLEFNFQTDTYSLDVTNTNVLAQRHVLTYGATARYDTFDLSIAPLGHRKNEQGAFGQIEFQLNDKLRWLVGGRWDHIDPIGSVFSPRTTLMIEPVPGRQTFRVSYNRAFRAPSLVNNYLDVTIVSVAPLPFVGDYPFPSDAVGNLDLKEETLDAYEIGYVGSIGNRTTVTASVYQNETKDSIDFYASSSYTSANPPPGFALPLFLLDVAPPFGLAGVLPENFTYRNIGRIVNRGIELSYDFQPAPAWKLSVNYSWQADPRVSGIDPVIAPNGNEVLQVNIPPAHRANAGLYYRGPRFFLGGNVNYASGAFWTDVLDSRYWGPTDSYFQTNLSGGVDLNRRTTLSVTAQNVFDERVQQHVFGDIIGRKLSGQVVWHF